MCKGHGRDPATSVLHGGVPTWTGSISRTSLKLQNGAAQDTAVERKHLLLPRMCLFGKPLPSCNLVSSVLSVQNCPAASLEMPPVFSSATSAHPDVTEDGAMGSLPFHGVPGAAPNWSSPFWNMSHCGCGHPHDKGLPEQQTVNKLHRQHSWFGRTLEDKRNSDA